MSEAVFCQHVCKTCGQMFLDLDRRNAEKPVMSRNCPDCKRLKPAVRRDIQAKRKAK